MEVKLKSENQLASMFPFYNHYSNTLWSFFFNTKNQFFNNAVAKYMIDFKFNIKH